MLKRSTSALRSTALFGVRLLSHSSLSSHIASSPLPSPGEDSIPSPVYLHLFNAKSYFDKIVACCSAAALTSIVVSDLISHAHGSGKVDQIRLLHIQQLLAENKYKGGYNRDEHAFQGMCCLTDSSQKKNFIDVFCLFVRIGERDC